MKYPAAACSLAILALCVAPSSSQAQTRSSIGFGQQNQRGFRTTSQSPFSQPGQSVFSQPGSNAQLGIEGQQGGFSGQQGQRTGQRQVGGQDGFVGTDAQQIRDRRMNNPRARRRMLFDFALESLNELRESRRQRRSRGENYAPVQVQFRPLFSVPQPSATQLTSQVTTRMNRALPTTVGQTQISVSGGTATIQGTASSDYDRQLAEKMLSLQPGITQVDNRITVRSDQEAPLFLPAR